MSFDLGSFLLVKFWWETTVLAGVFPSWYAKPMTQSLSQMAFIQRHIQMVKNMFSKSNTQSFKEVLADFRAMNIRNSLPLPAEILHGRNLLMKKATIVDYKTVGIILQERQLRQSLAHDKSHRAKKVRPLVVGERYYVLSTNSI